MSGKKKSITATAHKLVNGARQESYDHPAVDFTLTGRVWGALLERWRYGDETDVPPELVALLMVGLKLVRETHLHDVDNLVDGAGYLECADMVHEYRKEQHPDD